MVVFLVFSILSIGLIIALAERRGVVTSSLNNVTLWGKKITCAREREGGQHFCVRPEHQNMASSYDRVPRDKYGIEPICHASRFPPKLFRIFFIFFFFSKMTWSRPKRVDSTVFSSSLHPVSGAIEKRGSVANTDGDMIRISWKTCQLRTSGRPASQGPHWYPEASSLTSDTP